MNNKYKFILLNIFITIISIYFTYAVYFEYKKSQEKKVNAYVEKSIERNKSIIINTFTTIRDAIESDRKIFKEIHTYYTKKLRTNPKLDIRDLRKEIYSKYDLTNKDVHLFLLNKEYTVTDATYEPDIGFKLGLIVDARLELDRTHDGNVYQSQSVSIDIINSEIKSYSYSKINDELYFEMGFINKKINKILKDTIEKVQLVTNKKSNLYRIERKLNGDEYYDNILEKKFSKTKEEYISSKKMYPKDKATDDFVILSNRLQKELRKEEDNSLLIFTPLIKKSNEYLELMGDFVLKLDIDMTYKKQLDEKIDFYFYIFLIFHITFLLIIFYSTKKYYEALVELEKTTEKNHNLLEENKDFIMAITDQIKTPLSIIMNNVAFIEKSITKELNKYLRQTNSAIDMLKNSYDDLTYIVDNEKISYKKQKINISSFINERIDFFENILKTRAKTIKKEIEENLYVDISDTELERLIDNNISNAIKHSHNLSLITFKLYEKDSFIILSFYSYGDKIKDTNKIFKRNFKENDNGKKSLGLGLSMVSSICNKYDILYEVDFIENQNVFTYKFKMSNK